jgi:predicted outer membrane repeat protein
MMGRKIEENISKRLDHVQSKAGHPAHMFWLLLLCLLVVVASGLTGLTGTGAIANAAATFPRITTQVTDCSATSNTPGGAVGTLNYALSHYTSGDTIQFACSGGTASLYSINITAPIGISNTLTLDGNSYQVTLDGGNKGQIFRINAGGNFSLNDLTIANGKNTSNNCLNGSCGGGIYNVGSLTVTNDTFKQNYSTFDGGAIYNKGSMSIANSTFISNTAASTGGAVDNDGTISSLSNSTFISNTASSTGAAVLNSPSGNINIINSTFAYNSASLGGVIYNAGTVTLKNNILAHLSNVGNCTLTTGTFTDGGGNLSDDNSCSFSPSNRNDVTNLNLDTLKNNGGATQTMALLPNSAALFAGVTASCPATDQNNQPRPQPAGTACDAGAFESNLQLATSITAVGNPNPAKVSQNITLNATITVNGIVIPTGNVIFTDTTTNNTTLGNATLSGSSNNATLGGVTFTNAGGYNIAAGYLSNAITFTSASTSFTETVNVQPTNIAVFSGNGQSTPINTAFPATLSAIVRDATTNNPLPNVVVVFQAPNSSASGIFSTTNSTTFTATTNASGIATASTFTANGTVGSYQVTASTAGAASQAVFNLVNSAANAASGYSYYLPFLANNANGYTTYLVFQNTANVSSTVSISFFDNNGNPVSPTTGTCSSVAALGECIVPNPFADNKQGEGIIVSQQPLNVIVSDATPFGGSAYAVPAGASNTLIAPVAIKGGLVDFTTQLSIFNGGNSTVNGTVQFFDSNGNHISAADKSFSLSAHSTTTYDQSQDNTLANFYGWAQVSSPAGSALVAQTLEQRPSVKFVAIVNAQFNPQTTLYAPAIFNEAFGSFVTGANLVNPNSQPVTVTLTYYKNDGTASVTTPFTIAGNAVTGIFQGGTSGSGLPSGGLPNGWYGAVTVQVSGGSGIIMFVNEQGGLTATGSDQSGTYGAAVSGSSVIGLPVMANGAFGGYITGATIENITSTPVTASVQYYDLNGNTVGTAKSVTIGGNASYGLYQGGSDQALASGFYGTAQITVISGPSSSLLVTTNAQSNAFFYSYTEPSF